MNIAIVNVVGTEGSTGKIATKLARHYSAKGHVCRIYHGRGEAIDDSVHVKYGSKIDTVLHYALARVTGKEGYYSFAYTRKILSDIKCFSPQRIIILNLHGHWLNIPMFIKGISELDAQISWFMCDDFPFTARCTYTNDCEGYLGDCSKCPAYRNTSGQYAVKKQYYDKIISNTVFSSVAYVVNKAKQSSLLKNASFMVNNTGIDVDFYQPVDTTALREKYNISENTIVLLNVAPYSNERKGVAFYLEAAKALMDDPRFLFVNVGFDGNTSELPSNYLAIPYVSNQEELRQWYSLADRYVCTSVQDALPNACVEAMSCGTPLLAFDVSGMPFLADYPVLELVKEIDTKQLIQKISDLTKKDEIIIAASRNTAIEKYSFACFADRLMGELNETVTI